MTQLRFKTVDKLVQNGSLLVKQIIVKTREF